MLAILRTLDRWRDSVISVTRAWPASMVSIKDCRDHRAGEGDDRLASDGMASVRACGAPTKIMDAGYRRLCGKCNAEHFPRVDPVVIMLATHGEACLVGRGKQFPPGMFSALAGFVEPGETIEEAVRRELMEEASVKVGEVTYYATQPWPFPSSLMIGCFAKAESREVKADENELAEVRWLERSVARELIEGKQVDGVRVPPPIAIAHHLIKTWALGGA